MVWTHMNNEQRKNHSEHPTFTQMAGKKQDETEHLEIHGLDF